MSPQAPHHHLAIEVLKLEAACLETAAQRIAQDSAQSRAFDAVILALTQAVEEGHKIVVSGLGKSGKIGEKIAATFSSTGAPALFLHLTEGLHGDLGIVQAGDVVLALSQSGNSEEWLKLLPALKRRKVAVVALCGAQGSRLVAQADYWLNTAVDREACPHNLAPTTSTTLMLAFGDALAIALMRHRGVDAEHFAENHPAGSLGRRLTLRVADAMHGLAEVGVVSPQAPMDEVIQVATRTKLGGVCVVQGGVLLGLITDGDLRRALAHRDRFFSMQASEVMTAGPVSVGSEVLAAEALRLMQERPSQISVLPVITDGAVGADQRHKLLGMIRLHDLVKLL